ncbi:MAG TPA: PIN domain-containing protein [Thermoanaerobaculia bacterium]|nr:PIN domain-containing protein [Thermoanaerobaculia bacterium]
MSSCPACFSLLAPPARVDILLEQIRAAGVSVAARPLPIALPDSDDEAFLEVALASGARCLVTENVKHYPAEARSGVEVLSPRSFIEFYRGHSDT